MVTLSKIYTKTGDSGQTGLGDGSRISKASMRIAAIGAVDETNAAIGIARLDAEDEMDAMLARIQNDLFDLGADLCAPEDGRKTEGRLRIAGSQVERPPWLKPSNRAPRALRRMAPLGKLPTPIRAIRAPPRLRVCRYMKASRHSSPRPSRP